MSRTLRITEARGQIGAATRKAVATGERTYLNDHGHTGAVIMSVAELEDLEDTVAVLGYELRKARGEEPEARPWTQVKAELGL